MKKAFTFFLVAVLTFGFVLTAVSCSKSTTSTSSSGSTSAKADASEKITIAFIGNTTGDYAEYGVPVRNAVKMYFDQLNANGGINGKLINLLEYDDKGDPNEAVNAFNLAVDKGATAIFGSVLSAPTLALVDETYEVNMPQITGSATAAGVTVIDPEDPNSEVRTNVFRTCFIDPFQGEKMAEYANTVAHAKTAAIFFENGSDYSEGIAKKFEEKAAEYGIKIVAKESFSTGDVDYKAQMTNIAKANPDVVIMSIYYGQAGLAISALRSAGCKSQVIGGDGFGSISGYATAEELEGTVFVSGWVKGAAAEFEEMYAKTYESDMNMFAPLAWDGCLVITEGLKAAEKAGLKPGSAEYKQVMIDTMKAIKGLVGTTGTYSFDEYNNPVKSATIVKLTDGAEVFDRLL